MLSMLICDVKSVLVLAFGASSNGDFVFNISKTRSAAALPFLTL